MEEILKICNITKVYPGVVALHDVSISFKSGEVHALIGENGAGKSTLIKIVSGAIRPTDGMIYVEGNAYNAMTPTLSKKCGISVIYQEFNLVPTMSVAENIFLGDKIGSKFTINFKEMHKRAKEIFADFKVDIDTTALIEDLSTAQQQLVEIAKAIVKNTKLLIMDEPSATLAVAEVECMFSVIKKLKNNGVTVIYISHRLDEVFSIADTATVLRDGSYVATESIENLTRAKLISLMVGRELSESFPKRNNNLGEVVLEVNKLSGNGVKDISFKLHKGEILGIAGLVGAGRTELAKVIYGAAKHSIGEIKVNGKQVKMKTPSDAINIGIGLIPEDRKLEGAFLEFPIDWNITIMSLKSLSKNSVISNKEADKVVNQYAELLMIKSPSMKQLVRNLSGGNQQKVVIAKTLAAKTKIIIFDEPTRGIDVATKQEIYKLMNELIEKGISIIMISSEMEEVLGMSDRIIVLHQGQMAGVLNKDEFNQNRILELASGV